MSTADTPPDHRAGFCAILGRPNAGKSTYLNQTLGTKLVAVSAKPQTTRDRILGIKNLPGVQLIYVDTPGVHRSENALNQHMVRQALGAAGDADVLLVLIACPGAEGGGPGPMPPEETQQLLTELTALGKPTIIGINKVDKLQPKDRLLPVMAGLSEMFPNAELVPLSALKGDGVAALEKALAAYLPLSPPLYPDDQITDRPERFVAAELVREQLYHHLGQELPYETAVTILSFEERQEQNDVRIEAEIHVERTSQKSIVIGKGGQAIKAIGTAARHEIERLLGRRVHLNLFVKVTPKWSQTQEGLKRLGYEP